MRSGPLRVLVVEDEWIIAAEVEDMLGDAGYLVAGPAASVKAALALIDDAPVDAALLDINLSREMSFPVAEALMERGIPFLFVSGFVSSDLPPKFRACSLVTKPAPAHKLLGFLSGL